MITTFGIEALVNPARELQALAGARARVTSNCAAGTFDVFMLNSWKVLVPVCSPGTVPVIEPFPAGCKYEVTFFPFSVTNERRINAVEGAVILIFTASPEATNSANGVLS